VGLGRGGDGAGGLERLQRAEPQVVLHRQALKLGGRVAPTHQEDGEPLPHQVLDHAPAGADVHDVVFVDPRRDDDDGDAVDLLGLRRVLDQLDQLVAVDHLAGGERQVDADLELLLARDLHLPALEVVQQVVQPAAQILAAGVEHFAQHLRVGKREIRRAEHVRELADVEIDALVRARVKPFDVLRCGI
jgi:hypothetical protein